MCDFEKGFILCSCNVRTNIIPNKNSRRYKKDKAQKRREYIWTLFKFLGKSESPEMGRYFMPNSDLGNGLTSELVLDKLNKQNCFDFEYYPNDGDNLIINDSAFSSRIEFIFKNGTRAEDNYSPFDHKTERIFAGKVKKIEK